MWLDRADQKLAFGFRGFIYRLYSRHVWCMDSALHSCYFVNCELQSIIARYLDVQGLQRLLKIAIQLDANTHLPFKPHCSCEGHVE